MNNNTKTRSVLESTENKYGQRRHYQRQTMASNVQINDRVDGAFFFVSYRFRITNDRALIEIG